MKYKLIKILLIFFVSVIIISGFLFLSKNTDRFLEIDFLDVGQGDAILVITPENQTMLIDGGPNNRVLQKLGKYLPMLEKRIDIVLLTHPHADHVAGLVEVLKRYNVGAVILSGVELKTEVYSEFLKITLEKNVPIIIAEAGQAIHFDENLEFDILAGVDGGEKVFNKNSEGFGVRGNDVNDASIVGELIFSAKGGSASGGKDFSVIFMGDATSKIENQLLAYGENLESDILKAGHHGSKYSSSLLFLKFVSPKAAVIEVGAKNRYGHPTEATLSRLKMINANIFRTDQNGDIRVLSDGFTTNIYKEK